MKIYCDAFHAAHAAELMQCVSCGRYWISRHDGSAPHAVSAVRACLTHHRQWRELRRQRLEKCETRYGE